MEIVILKMDQRKLSINSRKTTYRCLLSLSFWNVLPWKINLNSQIKSIWLVFLYKAKKFCNFVECVFRNKQHDGIKIRCTELTDDFSEPTILKTRILPHSKTKTWYFKTDVRFCEKNARLCRNLSRLTLNWVATTSLWLPFLLFSPTTKAKNDADRTCHFSLCSNHHQGISVFPNGCTHAG